jgi:hypothetical protein
VISSWPGKFLSKQVTRPANRSGRRFASRFSRVCSPVLLSPRIAPSMARPARAVSATTRSCGNGEESSAVPVEPNIAQLAGVSGRFTSIPSAAHTIMPASSTADGSPSAMSGPAACQNRSSITPAGISSRHSVTTFPVGTCQPRANGTSASSPARRASDSQHDPSGIRVIAIISRMTSGYDMIRRRCRFFRRPFSSAASTIASISPSPRCRSSSPSRTRSGSHASARTVPSRRVTAGAVTTGRQNTVSSPAAGTAPPAVTVPPPRISRSAARTTTVPAGVLASGYSDVRLASATSGR